MGILFGLLAAISFAFCYVSLKKSYEEFPPSVAFFFDMVLGIFLWIPFSLILGFDFSHLGMVFVYALISAILSEAFFFYVLSKGEISVTGTILASYPIYTIFFSLFINKELLLPWHWVFVGITIFGTLLSSLPRKINKSELGKKSYIIWALAGAIAVGLSDSLSKNIIDKSSAASFLFALAITQIPISLLYLKIEKQSLRQFLALKKIFGKYRFSMAGSIFNVIGLIFLWLAFEYTYASIASPLTAAYPGLMVILAMLWLKEKPRKMELVGLGFIIVGIIGISSFY